MKIREIERSIPDITGLLVFIIAISAFSLSFVNLQELAAQSEINPYLTWLWPLCIDALLVAGSLEILRSSIKQLSTRVGWMVLISFTLVSISFNLVHSPDNIVSKLSYAIPPIALCVSVELLMRNIRTDLKSHDEVDNDTQVSDTPFAPFISAFKDLYSNLTVKSPATPDTTTTGDSSDSKRKTRNRYPDTDKLSQVTSILLNNPDTTDKELIEATGISRNTIKKYRTIIESNNNHNYIITTDTPAG